MATQLQEPAAGRSGASIHSQEEDEFAQQHEENPLEVTSSIQPTPSIMERQDPLGAAHTHHDLDEPPPPYTELELENPVADAPQIAPIEYSVDNSPQLLVGPSADFPEPPPRNPARLSSQFPEVSPVQTPGSPASPPNPSLVPAPLQLRPASPNANISRRPIPSPSSHSASTFSSAKAREAGFELQGPPSLQRNRSSSSVPSVTLIPSTEALRYTRESGKVMAYLIPFPKPRLKGVILEDIPERFLVYTPPLPPLSKPAPGEKEGHWHKQQRQWQEDVRKATMSNASKATWRGMKARSTSLINKGMNLTRSSNVEFLDRVSGGAVTATEDMEGTGQISDAPLSSEPSSTTSPSEVSISPPPSTRSTSTTSVEKESKPKALEELTLIYPPSLQLKPEQIRTEFVDTLLRTREKSRKEAFVASALVPLAAAVDASLIITFGGLTTVSGSWAYTSTRGAMTSKKISKGLSRSEQQALEQTHEHEHDETETRGCTCGHHEHDFGSPATIIKPDKKGKKKGINLQLQQSTHLEILRRYLDLACLKKDFNMFPQIEEAAGDVNEGSVLEAIGWRPVRRYGRDLELEYKDRVETFTSDQDEQYQTREARDDIKRYMRKGATEWVTWCKSFQKDPEAAIKK